MRSIISHLILVSALLWQGFALAQVVPYEDPGKNDKRIETAMALLAAQLIESYPANSRIIFIDEPGSLLPSQPLAEFAKSLVENSRKDRIQSYTLPRESIDEQKLSDMFAILDAKTAGASDGPVVLVDLARPWAYELNDAPSTFGSIEADVVVKKYSHDRNQVIHVHALTSAVPGRPFSNLFFTPFLKNPEINGPISHEKLNVMRYLNGLKASGNQAAMTVSEALDILELRGTDADLWKSRYKELAKRYHPDKNPTDPNALARFQNIQNAYGVLKKQAASQANAPSFSFSSADRQAAMEVRARINQLKEIFNDRSLNRTEIIKQVKYLLRGQDANTYEILLRDLVQSSEKLVSGNFMIEELGLIRRESNISWGTLADIGLTYPELGNILVKSMVSDLQHKNVILGFKQGIKEALEKKEFYKVSYFMKSSIIVDIGFTEWTKKIMQQKHQELTSSIYRATLQTILENRHLSPEYVLFLVKNSNESQLFRFSGYLDLIQGTHSDILLALLRRAVEIHSDLKMLGGFEKSFLPEIFDKILKSSLTEKQRQEVISILQHAKPEFTKSLEESIYNLKVMNVNSYPKWKEMGLFLLEKYGLEHASGTSSFIKFMYLNNKNYTDDAQFFKSARAILQSKWPAQVTLLAAFQNARRLDIARLPTPLQLDQVEALLKNETLALKDRVQLARMFALTNRNAESSTTRNFLIQEARRSQDFEAYLAAKNIDSMTSDVWKEIFVTLTNELNNKKTAELAAHIEMIEKFQAENKIVLLKSEMVDFQKIKKEFSKLKVAPQVKSSPRAALSCKKVHN